MLNSVSWIYNTLERDDDNVCFRVSRNAPTAFVFGLSHLALFSPCMVYVATRCWLTIAERSFDLCWIGRLGESELRYNCPYLRGECVWWEATVYIRIGPWVVYCALYWFSSRVSSLTIFCVRTLHRPTRCVSSLLIFCASSLRVFCAMRQLYHYILRQLSPNITTSQPQADLLAWHSDGRWKHDFTYSN